MYSGLTLMPICPQCKMEVPEGASVCGHCRANLRPGRTVLGVIVLLALIAVLAYLWGGHGGTIGTPTVTHAKYEQIQEGMTYDEVLAVIGVPGEQLSHSDIAGYETVMYSWKNPNGSNMNAMFQNGRLMTKAQFGLP